MGEPGHRVLVGHRLREVEHVGECGFLVVERVEPGAAERRSQCRRVDPDDRPQTRLPVLAEHDLLVLGAPVEDHRRVSLGSVVRQEVRCPSTEDEQR